MDIQVQVLSLNKIPAIFSITDIVEVQIMIDNVHHELVFWHDTVNDIWPTTEAVAEFLHQYRMIASPLWYLVKAFYRGEPLEFPLTIDDDWPLYFANG